MAIYRYSHDCGYQGEIFLRVDRDTLVVKCLGCGRRTIAKQLRSQTTKIVEHDGVTGVLERTKKDE